MGSNTVKNLVYFKSVIPKQLRKCTIQQVALEVILVQMTSNLEKNNTGMLSYFLFPFTKITDESCIKYESIKFILKNKDAKLAQALCRN